MADGKELPSGGVGYFPRSYQAYPNFAYPMEYQQYIIGPLLVNQMKQQQVLELSDAEYQPDMPIWEAVFIFLAAKIIII